MKDRLLICLPQKEKVFQALPFSCFWKFTCCKFNEIQISPKEDIKVTSLFSVIQAKYQIQQYSTEKEKIEYNYLSVVSGQKISLVWSFISFSQGMARTSKQVQIKSKQQQQNTTEHVFCQDALTQTLCRQGTNFFFECFSGAEIESKSVFERRVTTGSGSTFFPFNIPPR